MTDDQLMLAATAARSIVPKGNAGHAAWDIIFDAEAHACGHPERAILRRMEVERLVFMLVASGPRT